MSPIVRFEKSAKYSRVVVHNGIAYLTGLTADDTSKDIGGQTEELLAKADRYLALAGSHKSRLLSAQIWLREMADFDGMNDVWIKWIDPDEPPSRATVESKLALPDLRVEIRFVAAVG